MLLAPVFPVVCLKDAKMDANVLLVSINEHLTESHAESLRCLKSAKKRRKSEAVQRMKTALLLHDLGLLTEASVLSWAKYGFVSKRDFNGEIKGLDDTKRKLKSTFGQCSEDLDKKHPNEDCMHTIRIPYDMGSDYHGPQFYRIYTLQPEDVCRVVKQESSYTTIVCNRPQS
jgi:hypothetical protein